MTPRSCTRRVSIALLGSLAAAAWLAAAPPAQARDNFYVGYSSGGFHPGHGYGHRRHHRPQPVVVYDYRPPVIVTRPAPVIVYQNPPPPPPVVVTYAATPPADAYCREFQNNVVIGNVIHAGYGTACLMPDGSWRIVSTR